MLKQRKNKIIELFGLPGSGKTALSRFLVEDISNLFRAVEIKYRLSRFFYFFIFLILNFRLILTSFFYIRKCNRVVRPYVRHLFILSCSKTMKAKIKSFFSNKLFIIDEGLFQRYLSILEKEVGREEMQKYIQYIPNWIDLVVFFEGGNFDRFTTLVDAHNNPRVIAGSQYLNNWISSQKTNYLKFKDLIKENKSVDFLEINNSERAPFKDTNILEDIKSKI